MTALLLTLLALRLPVPVTPPEPILEPIEWVDIWVPHANENDLPRVLLVGDSITRGYYPVVASALEEKAYCARFATSMFLSNPDYLATLSILLKRYDFAVIHINNGLHGFGYTEQQYAEGLQLVVDQLRKLAPRAQIIWALTTPVRQRGNPARLNDRITARVRQRNQLARSVMERHGIPINDLFTPVRDRPEYYRSDGVHFTSEGYRVLGRRVAEAVRHALERRLQSAPPRGR